MIPETASWIFTKFLWEDPLIEEASGRHMPKIYGYMNVPYDPGRVHE
ncbi:MAG: hypothetical protein H5T33_02550 [Candidatus Methanosuratus sp.]|nr:hypothetical protein [Candidatus Methanosuratincola sp.]